MNYEEKNAALDAVICPLPNPRYTIDAAFRYIEHMLNGYDKDWGGLNQNHQGVITRSDVRHCING